MPPTDGLAHDAGLLAGGVAGQAFLFRISGREYNDAAWRWERKDTKEPK